MSEAAEEKNQLIFKAKRRVSYRSHGLAKRPCLISRLESRESREGWGREVA